MLVGYRPPASQQFTNSIAVWGVPGYTFKGIYKELQRRQGSSVQNYIVAARTAQGYEEWHNSNQQERLDVVSRWQAIQREIENEKHHARQGSFHERHCYLKATIEQRKKHSAEKKEKRKQKKNIKGNSVDHNATAIPPSHPFIRQKSVGSTSENDDFEEAIRASVAATSHGNPEEDQIIERAIRASVQELHLASNEGDDKDALQRAIQASVAEATRGTGQDSSRSHAVGFDGHSDHRRELEASLHRSLQGHHPSETHGPVSSIDFDDSGVDTDDDENIKLAMERSKSGGTVDTATIEAEDKDLLKALENSKKDYSDLEQSLSKAKTEEDIVLEYVKKQSLAEEQHKKSVPATQTAIEKPE